MIPPFFFGASPASADVVTTSTATAASLRKFMRSPSSTAVGWTIPTVVNCRPFYVAKKGGPEAPFSRSSIGGILELEAQTDFITAGALPGRRLGEPGREAVEPGLLIRGSRARCSAADED